MAHYPGAKRPRLVIASNFQNPLERSYLEGLAAALRVEVELCGNITDQSLVELYNQARVVAYAPVREPFGLVPLEAMACATPVVAVKEGGVPESVIHGETGLLVERDAEQFGLALCRLVEDSLLARRYGDSGRAHVMSRWTWEVAVATLEDRLIATAQSRTPAESRVPAFEG
jgi:glycosyltransferase involved in cell wall biosynthesis